MTGPSQPPKAVPGKLDQTSVGANPGAGAGVTRVTGGAQRTNLSTKTMELGRSFLSALFMGLRTAQIHDSANKAFERAVQSVRIAADQLFSATGGFSINFVDESAFLNGVRLRFDGGAFDAMRTLRHILESKELGGIEMRAPPSYDAIRKLVLLFSANAPPGEAVTKEDLLAMQIGMLGVQRFADASRDNLRVDRRIFAVQCYAKLLLAFREQIAAADGNDRRGSNAPRLRAVRVVQDLVELCGDRADFLLRLGSNHTGAPVDELHAVNVAVLSVALGHALGLGRQELVDIGVSALFHDVARTTAIEPEPVAHPNVPVLGDDEAAVIAYDSTPIAYDGELIADDWEDERKVPMPSADDGEEPVPLPVEYLGHLTPLDPAELADPAEAGSPYDFNDVTTQEPLSEVGGDAEGPDTAESMPAEAEPELLDPSALMEADVELAARPRGMAIPRGDTELQSVAPYHPIDATQPLEVGAGHAEEGFDATEHPHTFASYARLLALGGLSRTSLMRAIVAAEHHTHGRERFAWGEQRRKSHLFARVVAVADAYDALTSGLGTGDGQPMHPLDALEKLLADRTGRVDPRLVDLLINVLRAFPVGTNVVLDTGERAVVTSHAGGTRWDRPVTRTLSREAKSVDLMMRKGDRFLARILGTARFIGEPGERGERGS